MAYFRAAFSSDGCRELGLDVVEIEEGKEEGKVVNEFKILPLRSAAACMRSYSAGTCRQFEATGDEKASTYQEQHLCSPARQSSCPTRLASRRTLGCLSPRTRDQERPKLAQQHCQIALLLLVEVYVE